MFNIIVISVLIVLIIHYTIDIFTKVEQPNHDPRVNKYKTIMESSLTNTKEEDELNKYIQTII